MPSQTVTLVSTEDGAKTEVPYALMQKYCGLVRDLTELHAESDAPEDSEEPLEIEIPTKKSIAELIVAYLNARKTADGEGDAHRQPKYPKPLATRDLTAVFDSTDLAATKDWDDDATIEIIKVSNLLVFTEMIQVANIKLAASMMSKTTDEVRTMLGIVRDMTDEEEDTFRFIHGIPPATGREEEYAKLEKTALQQKQASVDSVATKA